MWYVAKRKSALRNTQNRNNNKSGAARTAPIQSDMEQTEQEKAAIEYNRRIRAREFSNPEILTDKSIGDVLIMPEFVAILKAYIAEQIETRKQVLKTIEALKQKGKKVPEKRPTIDRVLDLGLMDAGTFAVEFAKVLNKESKYPVVIRDYIRQLGMKAYNATLEKFICDANPDMAELQKQATSNRKS